MKLYIILLLLIIGVFVISCSTQEYASAKKYNITLSNQLKSSLKHNYDENINTTFCVYGNTGRANYTYTFISMSIVDNCNTAYRLRVSDSCVLDDNDKSILNSGKVKIYLLQCKNNNIIFFDNGIGYNYEI